MLISVLILLGALSVGALLVWERNDMARTRIEGDLKGRRATDINIAMDWFDFGRDGLTYDVVYTDASGQRVSNRAKVGVRPHADGSVFWQRPVS